MQFLFKSELNEDLLFFLFLFNRFFSRIFSSFFRESVILSGLLLISCLFNECIHISIAGRTLFIVLLIVELYLVLAVACAVSISNS